MGMCMGCVYNVLEGVGVCTMNMCIGMRIECSGRCRSVHDGYVHRDAYIMLLKVSEAADEVFMFANECTTVRQLITTYRQGSKCAETFQVHVYGHVYGHLCRRVCRHLYGCMDMCADMCV